MSKGNRYVLGKCDYNNSGRKNCEAAFTWELKSGRFSLCAEIWNPRKTDIYCGGQCIEEVLKYFPHDKHAQAMTRVWRQYHLNDMKAGSPAQEAHLKANAAEWELAQANGVNHYDWALATLEAAGLQPDESFLYGGIEGQEHIKERKPYSYGSAWLTESIPPAVIAEIESWSADLIPEPPDPFSVWIAAQYDFKAVYVEEGERGDEYRCTFNHKTDKRRRLVVPFYQGIGNRKNMLGKTWSKKRAQMYDSSFSRENFSPVKSAPTAKMVLDALLRDAHSYVDNADVADFCENFGYDLREGRRIHAACEKTHADLRAFTGADFGRLMDEEGDL